MDDVSRYADIIDLPHHVSKKHPQMSMANRAAQFSPFAAVSGHDDAIEETARVTEEKIELTEDEKTILDGKLQMIQAHIKEQPEVTVTYFVPDKKKTGGAYVTVTGVAKRIDDVHRTLYLKDEQRIKLDDVLTIKCLHSIISPSPQHQHSELR